MDFHRPLDGILGSRPKVALLRLLARGGGEHTGRFLARRVGYDPKTCQTALRDLVRQGVVERRAAGAAHLYRLNDRHVLVRKLLAPLFRGEGGLVRAYVEDFRKRVREPLLSLILFGSVAKAEERPSSDVDLLAIVPERKAVRKVQEACDRAAAELAARYGNPPQVIVLDLEGFRRRARSRDPFISEVLRSGKVLEGKPLGEVLGNVSEARSHKGRTQG